ncbi:MAG: macrolide ABC transporter ATP-binding protein [Nitrospirae bacterium CG18_big_fil_WC_8_21_14_2_50_70_55]|nr:ABC transporter ATP-binding protein [Deltaproteobacteria bacterium]OIP65583.1 MAG: macrolide ABC transporter ATP-binding protein [Nitrospirae bacterium CG2_30_70_394]PIQ04780.1 MAG: macrolide ABC transporter ATP-binding protein [Nitrospirae bacterium CG18_big_fil_WC_8_21_14_2_50_70_55]PIU78220.1 MAG: macrolide ABC transporter ATP-binding protein [Nitrospirae bacterium CG06_land_8_20_14_3_00_70_43]PIW82225.1 MAG: macrolide ABC transporter ATP-binding protein [Nitrospirae bacterium CG_4_8_14_3
MIELASVARTFWVGEEEVHALAGVDLTVAAGDHLVILGASGSGKSTLLNILGLLDRPTTGTYRFDGRDVSALADGERTRLRRDAIGFVFQFFHLVPRLTALENVALPMVFAGVARTDRRARAAAALEAVGLTARATHRPDQLSGGERQRVAIARATVMGPRLLLADEPTGNLDSASGRAVLDLLEGMNRAGLTLVVITHDPAIAVRATRHITLRDGRIVAQG